ncbi:zinc finger BED domain-containing protein 4-like [Ischnura elegans]|uniref:zinc finger BED domain-containing protein 4-like n=1 Tax=Ischnura elegans TaxID=197161 RepID=UPI001ED8A54A|nr:zinc finger BED domain-containing protein 4-like [Ischnura elegans]
MALFTTDIEPVTEEEWFVLTKACELLRLFYEVTVELSSENKVTISKVILVSKALQKHVERINSEANLPEGIKKMATKISDQMKIRFAEIEANPILSESTLLDPRFKKHGFTNEVALKNTTRAIQQRLSTLQACSNAPEEPRLNSTSSVEPSTSSIWEDFDNTMEEFFLTRNSTAAGIIEFEKYMREDIIKRTENPLAWWVDRKTLYPHLFDIMYSRLAIPATSVPCERIFSKSGQILSEKRNRLSSKRVSEIMFLNANLQ